MPFDRILLVEDSSSIRDLIGRVLRPEGFEVAEAADGAAALQILSEHEPDLLILDLILPGTNGFAVLEALRTHPRLSRLPIVIITGSIVAPGDFVGSRVVATLRKPFTAHALLGTVREVFANRNFDRSRQE